MKKVYMLGIGGVSMSALAVMLKAEGYQVSGWDENTGKGVQILQDNNIEVDLPTKTKKIPKKTFQKIENCDLVVHSSAIKNDDPLMLFAKKMSKKIVPRGVILGQISQNYEKVVAVAGSHGKTTTTAMIYNILRVSGKQPTLHLGGYKIDDGLNFAIGEKEFFITEACEYHDNFLFLRPYVALITNVEPEHLDYFKSFENEKKSFEQFRKNSCQVVENLQNLQAKHVCHDRKGRLVFSLVQDGQKIMNLHLNICEEVNTQNCVNAFLVAKKLGISDCFIKQGLQEFKGVQTRFERKESKFFENVIFDYAHHPTEISKAILSAKKIFKEKTLVVIFQPHTFSRTKTLLPEFVKVFETVEYPIIFKTYSAREEHSDGLSGRDLAKILQKNNKNARYFDNFSNLQTYLKGFSSKNTILLFVGAGDLPTIAQKNKFVK